METTLEVLPTRKSGREVHRHCLMRSRRSLRTLEKTDLEQFDLALEDLETAMAAIHAEHEAEFACWKLDCQATRDQSQLPSKASSWRRRGDVAGQPDLRLRRLPELHWRGRFRASGVSAAPFTP